MRIPKASFEKTLEREVVSPGRCWGCGACVISCPLKVLEYVQEKPELIGKCTACGICPRICPVYEASLLAMEEFVFGRKRKPEEAYGIYQRIVIARARDEAILQTCQDGGVVTALLMFALEKGTIDGAVVSGVSWDKPLHPVPRLATTPKEVLKCAGTRYTYSPNLLAFREAVELKKGSLAFVGTPCHIHALRRMQMLPLKKYAKALNFTIGLMCTESFTYQGLMEKQIQEMMGVDLLNVKKINIKAKVLVTTGSGEVKVVPLKEAKQYSRKACDSCTDFSAELADISAGGVGLKGWTLTILRTKKGEEVFEQAEREGLIETKPMEKEVINLVIKLSKRKRRRAWSFIR